MIAMNMPLVSTGWSFRAQFRWTSSGSRSDWSIMVLIVRFIAVECHSIDKGRHPAGQNKQLPTQDGSP